MEYFNYSFICKGIDTKAIPLHTKKHTILYKLVYRFSTLSAICCLCIFFSSCRTSNDTTEETSVIISINSQASEKKLKMSELYSELKYIRLETIPESLIAQISKVIPLDNHLLILDKESSQILLFDLNGKFLRTIGNKGAGVGEFIEIEDMTVDRKGEKVFVLDSSGKQLLIYDIKGDFIKNVRIDFITHEIEYLENGSLVCYCDYATNETYEKNGARPNLILLDLSDMKTYTYLYAPQSISVQEVNSPFSALSSHTPQYVFLFDVLTNSIYEIEKKGINRTFMLNFGDTETKIKESYIRRLEEAQLTADRIRPGASDSPQYSIITSCISCDNYLFLNVINYSTTDVYQIAYSPDNSKCIYGKMKGQFPIENDIDGITPFAPYAACQNKIYGVIESYQLASNLANAKLNTVLMGVKEDDNPIIVIANAKRIN